MSSWVSVNFRVLICYPLGGGGGGILPLGGSFLPEIVFKVKDQTTSCSPTIYPVSLPWNVSMTPLHVATLTVNLNMS